MTGTTRALPDGTTPPRGLGSSDKIRWPLVPARDLFDLIYGKALVASSRKAGPIPVYGTNGQCGWHDTSLFSGPGVVLGRKGQGPLGVEWVKGDYWVIDTGYSLRPKSGAIDLRYSYFLIDFIGLNHLKDGTSNPTLSREVFGSQALPLPPLPEQRAIAATLEGLDDKIELNRRTNETLEGMAQAIFRDWFVDFGPVRRAQAGVTDPVALLGGLTADAASAAQIAALFPASFGDDDLPLGWSEAPIGDLVKIQGGSTPSTADESLWSQGVHHWATPKDLSNMENLALFGTSRQISDAGLAKITAGLLPAGSVLLSSRAPIGYLAIAQVPVAINQGFIGLLPTAEIGSAYLYFWCKANMDKITANANGSTFQEISKRNFRPITSPVPNNGNIITSFGEIASPLIDRIVAAAKETQILAETRDYLLPRLMSGEVRVAPEERV